MQPKSLLTSLLPFAISRKGFVGYVHNACSCTAKAFLGRVCQYLHNMVAHNCITADQCKVHSNIRFEAISICSPCCKGRESSDINHMSVTTHFYCLCTVRSTLAVWLIEGQGSSAGSSHVFCSLLMGNKLETITVHETSLCSGLSMLTQPGMSISSQQNG